jgi:hypothetical protein
MSFSIPYKGCEPTLFANWDALPRRHVSSQAVHEPSQTLVADINSIQTAHEAA